MQRRPCEPCAAPTLLEGPACPDRDRDATRARAPRERTHFTTDEATPVPLTRHILAVVHAAMTSTVAPVQVSQTVGAVFSRENVFASVNLTFWLRCPSKCVVRGGAALTNNKQIF